MVIITIQLWSSSSLLQFVREESDGRAVLEALAQAQFTADSSEPLQQNAATDSLFPFHFFAFMRIAVSGSHATGKSTLLQELTRRRPDIALVDESYHRLVAAGHVISHPPNPDDFEQLFDHALTTINASYAQSVAFDRSPADYLAYLAALQPGTSFADHVAATAAALQTLDLVVFVPIERRDRIATFELPRLRRRVNALLHEMLVAQTWGFAVPVIEVSGTVDERVDLITDQLLQRRG